MDRQSVVQALVEDALRAAADPSVTTVLRDWDYYEPGTSEQPLAPFLVVGFTDDIPYGIGIGLYRCFAQIMIAVADSPSVREDFDRIRASVRSVMASLAYLSAYGLTISGVLEQGCTQPAPITESGDIILAQILTWRMWFEAPEPPLAILDPIPYLVERDPATGATYLTCQEQDPRRIDRYLPAGSTLLFSQGFGAWEERATLAYTSPVQPLSTQLPPQADTPSAP